MINDSESISGGISERCFSLTEVSKQSETYSTKYFTVRIL